MEDQMTISNQTALGFPGIQFFWLSQVYSLKALHHALVPPYCFGSG
jgi:hypothetical protein